jgi:hypothetical protein
MAIAQTELVIWCDWILKKGLHTALANLRYCGGCRFLMVEVLQQKPSGTTGNTTSDKGKPVARRGRKANGSSALRGTAGPPELHRLADETGKTGGSRCGCFRLFASIRTCPQNAEAPEKSTEPPVDRGAANAAR